MRTVLRIENQIVAVGPVLPLGLDGILTVTRTIAGESRAIDYLVTSGDTWVLGLNPSGIDPGIFASRVSRNDLNAGLHSDYTAEMFYQIILGYWGERFAYNNQIASISRIIQYQMPSHGIAGAPISVVYAFGIARIGSYKSREVDVRDDLLAAEHVESSALNRRTFFEIAGEIGSYLEGAIFEHALLTQPELGVSSVAILRRANEQGIPIHTISEGNFSVALGLLTVSQDVRDRIQNAVLSGKTVTIPRSDIAIGTFQGTGYIIKDPSTGAAAYELSGGRNGGGASAPENVFPLPQAPANPVIGIVLSSALRTAGASLVVEGGAIIGISLGAAAAVTLALLAAIVGLIVVASLIAQSQSRTIEQRHPPTNKRFRHYTNVAAKIVELGLIYRTAGGTLGDGVYVADADDEVARGVGCPPNAVDIVTRFQIPAPGQEDPSRVTGYVDFAVTRDNYFVIDTDVNGRGQREFVIRAPLAPIPDVRPNVPPNTITPALIIRPGAFGIALLDPCIP